MVSLSCGCHYGLYRIFDIYWMYHIHHSETCYPVVAGLALLPLFHSGGLGILPDERKEGDVMYVTYQDLIQIGILMVALAHLFYQIYKGKKE